MVKINNQTAYSYSFCAWDVPKTPCFKDSLLGLALALSENPRSAPV